MKAKPEKVVFLVDCLRLDINCAYLVSEPSQWEKMVRMKHRARAVSVPALRCHDTIEEAKTALLKWIEDSAESVRGLEYDEENFWVA
jgi:hypothetical protein